MSTPSQPFKEGRIPFKIPSREVPCETYHKIYGDIRNTGPPPLIVLHGGPGSGHEYMEPYRRIWHDYGIPIVFYDQIGCASSTHLPDTMGDNAFWQPSLFADEVENLIKHLGLDGPGFHILGHSRGGTLAVAFAARQPAGLRRLILAGANSDSQIFKKNLWELKKQLPEGDQRAVEEAIQKDDFTSPEYLKAMETFRSTFLCRARPYPPPELAVDMNNQNADTTVRRTM